jgi:hypothetical protein
VALAGKTILFPPIHVTAQGCATRPRLVAAECSPLQSLPDKYY